MPKSIPETTLYIGISDLINALTEPVGVLLIGPAQCSACRPRGMASGNGAMAMTPHVLIVAGSDSSGGAGIARDIETASAFGLRSCLAVTAVTVQTHAAVERIEQMPPKLIAAQMRAAFAANMVAAVKIGMLGTKAAIEAVGSVLADYSQVPVAPMRSA